MWGARGVRGSFGAGGLYMVLEADTWHVFFVTIHIKATSGSLRKMESLDFSPDCQDSKTERVSRVQ